jgi:hypothetical protein
MKQAYKFLFIVVCLTCMVSLKALAIDNDGGIVDDVPVDGGLSLLVAAGVGYGIKKVKARKANSKVD